jgi:hypothetical protein
MAPVDDELQIRLHAWSELRALEDVGALNAGAVNALREGGLRVF